MIVMCLYNHIVSEVTHFQCTKMMCIDTRKRCSTRTIRNRSFQNRSSVIRKGWFSNTSFTTGLCSSVDAAVVLASSKIKCASSLHIAKGGGGGVCKEVAAKDVDC